MTKQHLTSPVVLSSPTEVYNAVQAARRQGQRVGLVLTMGALHKGHLSLVAASRRSCDVTFATIFVNPTQFGPGEDFEKYPRNLSEDLTAFAEAGVDFVFTPSRDELYPEGFSTFVDPPTVALPFEGQHRPQHFSGVATIVLKLFNILPAHVSFFGQKDYQQCIVLRRMAKDFNLPIEIEMCPIIREEDGLAMSSRNRYLSPLERTQALALSRGLREAENSFRSGETNTLKLVERIRTCLADVQIEQIDYVAVVDAQTLENVPVVERPAVALLAARIGTTRLIDNTILRPH